MHLVIKQPDQLFEQAQVLAAGDDMDAPAQLAFAFQVLFIEPAGAHMAHLRQLLEFEGFEVVECGAGDLHTLPTRAPHLAVLNHVRLRGSTLALAQAIGTGVERPLTLALVAAGEELKGVELVERGLDSYLAVPCGSREFVAQVRAMLRRVSPEQASAGVTQVRRRVRMRHLDVDPARRRVQAAGGELRLTEQEFQLLYFLAGHPGRDRPRRRGRRGRDFAGRTDRARACRARVSGSRCRSSSNRSSRDRLRE